MGDVSSTVLSKEHALYIVITHSIFWTLDQAQFTQMEEA